MTVVDPPARLLGHPGSGNPATVVTHGANGTVLRLSGEQDIATREQLCNLLASEFNANDGDLIVDLAAVTFIDGSTLGVLLRGRQWMRERGRWLNVRDPSRCAQRLLELCGMTGLLDTSAAGADPRTDHEG